MTNDRLSELAESYYGKPKSQSGIFWIVCIITIVLAFGSTFIPEVDAQTRRGTWRSHVNRQDPTTREMALAIRALENKVRNLERRVRTLER